MKYTRTHARARARGYMKFVVTGALLLKQASPAICVHIYIHTQYNLTCIHASLICIHKPHTRIPTPPALHVYGTDRRPWWATSNQILINHLATTWTWRHINSVNSHPPPPPLPPPLHSAVLYVHPVGLWAYIVLGGRGPWHQYSGRTPLYARGHGNITLFDGILWKIVLGSKEHRYPNFSSVPTAQCGCYKIVFFLQSSSQFTHANICTSSMRQWVLQYSVVKTYNMNEWIAVKRSNKFFIYVNRKMEHDLISHIGE